MLVDEPFRYRITDFDWEVFRLFVPTDHPLAVALCEIGWEDLRQTVEAYYSHDKGQPAIDPVRMLKLEFLRYFHNLSDRQVILRTKTDIAFRYFLQVGHTFRAPDFSSLSYFRGRLGEERNGMQLRYAVQAEPAGVADAVFRAEATVRGPFGVVMGDCYFEGDLGPHFGRWRQAGADGAVLVEPATAAGGQPMGLVASSGGRITGIFKAAWEIAVSSEASSINRQKIESGMWLKVLSLS